MKIRKQILVLLISLVFLITGCASEVDISEDNSGYLYEDFVTPLEENLSFATITIKDEPEKTRAISMINPLGSLPQEDSIVYINSDYDKNIEVPKGSYCIYLEKSLLNSYSISKIGVTEIKAKSGSYLIFTGEYNILFAKSIYSLDKVITLNNLAQASKISYYPSIKIENDLIRITNTPNASLDKEGIYVYDSRHKSSYISLLEKEAVQIAVVNNLVAYVGEPKEQVAIPTSDGYLICFYGKQAVERAKDIKQGQSAESIYLDIKKGYIHVLKIGDKEVGINNTNSYRDENTTVIFTPENGYNRTGTNKWGYEYVVSNGVVTKITEPQEEDSGNAEIPIDGYVISTLSNASEYAILRTLKIGDKVEIKTASNQYITKTIAFNSYNSRRETDQIIIYNSEHGKSTRTNEWGYEIIVDAKGKIIGDDGDGDAFIPEDGFVISGTRDPRFKLVDAYIMGATVVINNDTMTFSVIYSPMDDYANTLQKFALLKQKAKTSREDLLDIDHEAIGNKISEINQVISKAETASGIQLSDYQVTVVNEVKKLYNLLIPSLAIEDRGAWHIPTETNDQKVLETIDAALGAGLNYIILSTWDNGYVNFRTHLDNVLINPVFKDYDVLEAFVRLGKEKGLEIHAGLSVFMVGQRDRNLPVNHPARISNWQLQSKTGYLYSINEYGEFSTLDPFNSDVRSYLLSIFKEIVSNYEVDGISYDYIRYPKAHYETGDFGYNSNTINAFQDKYKTSVNPATLTSGKNLFNEWSDFRRDTVTSFVRDCTLELKKIKSDLFVSAAVAADIQEGRTELFQDTKEWAVKEYLDAIIPMSYTPSMSTFDSYLKQAVLATEGRVRLVMGLGTYEMYPKETVLSQIEFSSQITQGTSFFTLNSLLTPDYYNLLSEGIFKRTAVTVGSKEAFEVARDDLVRRIEDIYIPFSQEYGSQLSELKNMLYITDKTNIELVAAFCHSNLDGIELERVSESINLMFQLAQK